MLRSIDDIYGRFTSLVSEGRGISVEQVDAVGQGRVWTGSDALGVKLVDETGTLEDAVAYAAVLAGESDLSKWDVQGYPKPLTVMEQMFSKLGGSESDEDVVLSRFKGLDKVRIEARLPYEIELSY